MKYLKEAQGSLLAEALIAISITSIFAITIASLIMASLQSTKVGGAQTQASALAKEGLEATRSMVASNWNMIYRPLGTQNKGDSNPYHIVISSNQWNLASGSEAINLNDTNLTRELLIYDVKREQPNGNGIIKTDGSGYNDPSTQLVKVRISSSGMHALEYSEYFSRWSNKILKQNNWSGGADPAVQSVEDPNNSKYQNANNIDTSNGLRLSK